MKTSKLEQVEIWKPTLELRWLNKKTHDTINVEGNIHNHNYRIERNLQQKYKSNLGNEKWEIIPTINE